MSKTGADAAKEDLERVTCFKDFIINAAEVYGHEPAVIAAIVSRETRGNPAFFIGDNGHGHGPMQIDNRFWPQWCAEYVAKKVTDGRMIERGGYILKTMRTALQGVTPEIIDQASIAAYNCGAGNVKRALLHGLDVDHFTTGANYSKDVLARAAFFAEHGFPSLGAV